MNKELKYSLNALFWGLVLMAAYAVSAHVPGNATKNNASTRVAGKTARMYATETAELVERELHATGGAQFGPNRPTNPKERANEQEPEIQP